MVMKEVVILCVILPLIYGYCFTRNGRVDVTVSGRKIPVCEYNGLDLLEGSSFRTAACMACRCNNGIIKCCGFGVQKEETTYTPPQCVVIADGCDPLLVLKSNRTLDCHTGRPITERKIFNPENPTFPGTGTWYPNGFQQNQQNNGLGNLLLLKRLADNI